MGDLSLMIEWSWRIERPRSILGGSWSPETRWPTMIEKLRGSTVTGIETFGQLPEILVSLSNGLRVASFMTEEGQPAWALIAHGLKEAISVSRGRLLVESIAPE